MTKVKVNKRRVFFICFFLLLIVLTCVVGVYIYKELTYVPYYEIESREDKIKNTVLHGAQAYAWVRVQGTNVDTPVVIVNEELDADVFADYAWTSRNYVEKENRKVIYGHNVRNISSTPEIGNSEHFRFEQLMAFSYYAFAKENLYIQYHNGEEEALYKIYAVSFNSGDVEYGQSYRQEDVKDYIEMTRSVSLYDYDVDVNENDEIISLVTCTRYFGANTKTQFKVDARKLRENEKIVKYNVETTSNYDIIE